jgi:hypothetical protein
MRGSRFPRPPLFCLGPTGGGRRAANETHFHLLDPLSHVGPHTNHNPATSANREARLACVIRIAPEATYNDLEEAQRLEVLCGGDCVTSHDSSSKSKIGVAPLATSDALPGPDSAPIQTATLPYPRSRASVAPAQVPPFPSSLVMTTVTSHWA